MTALEKLNMGGKDTLQDCLTTDGTSELQSGPRGNRPEDQDVQKPDGETKWRNNKVQCRQEWQKIKPCGDISGMGFLHPE